MTQQGNLDIYDKLWEAAVERLPEFSLEQQRVGLALLAELSEGKPVSAAQLGRSVGIGEADAARYLHDSGLSSLIYTNEDGAALGVFGLSLAPTDHRLTVNGRTLWAWCAVDTLFLPELLGTTATVESRDPVTGAAVALTVSPTAVESVDPEGVLVSMNSPETWETTSAVELMLTACHYIHFFASSDSARQWTDSHADTVLLPVHDAFDYARRQNRKVLGDALAERASSSG